jgi:hypothetical protein
MDAFRFTLGAVIMQEYEDGLHPVAFHSQRLTHPRTSQRILLYLRYGWTIRCLKGQ